jgi:hypothetical protein
MSILGRRRFLRSMAAAVVVPVSGRLGERPLLRAAEPILRRTTPPLAVFEKGTRPEQSFYQQVIGKRIGRWYANAPEAFPRAIALAQAAMSLFDKTNTEYVKARRAKGYYGDRADEDETLRRQFFATWDDQVLKEQPDFWSVTPTNNPFVLGSTHFPEGFKGFIILARGRPVAETSVTYDHELTHYYLLSDKDREHISIAATSVVPDGFGLEQLAVQVFGQATNQNLAKTRYWLQPAEIDVSLAEIKRRFAFNEKKQMRGGRSRYLSPGQATAEEVWAWWAEDGAKQSRESEEPAGVALEPGRFELLDKVSDRYKRWIFRRLYEVV